MNNIKYIKDGLSLIYDRYIKGIRGPVLLSNFILYGVIVGVIIIKNVMVDYSNFTWWDKFLFAFLVSFIFIFSFYFL